MSTVVQVKGYSPISEEIETLFKELKGLTIELQERGRYVPMSMEEDPDVTTVYFQVKELNDSLEKSKGDPLKAFAAANNIFASYASVHQNYLAAASSVKAALGIQTSKVVSRMQNISVRFESLLHKMVANASVTIKNHAKELGISSFSVTVNSSPPAVLANFGFLGKASK
jgi:hypothetical protein